MASEQHRDAYLGSLAVKLAVIANTSLLWQRFSAQSISLYQRWIRLQ
jgi:hypothetical protein